jgi:hypothetical protein
VNQHGTDTDTKTIVYTQPVVELPPVITLTNPKACPALFGRGTHIFTGIVRNVSNASEVVILYNNAHVVFNSTITENVLSFSFPVSMLPSTVNIPLVITATNAGGTDVESCSISLAGAANPGNGSGGPNGETGGQTDDENGGGRTVAPGTARPKPTTVPAPAPTRAPAKVGRP